MRTRRIPLIIPADDYNRLVEVAQREERDPLQQARWLLRHALKSAEQPVRRLSSEEVADG